MWDREATDLAISLVSFALASIVLASMASTIMIGLEEMLYLRAYVQRAIVLSWISGNKGWSAIVLSWISRRWSAIVLSWIRGNKRAGGNRENVGPERIGAGSKEDPEERMLSLTGAKLYTLPQRQLRAQVYEALTLDWKTNQAGALLESFKDRYGQLPPAVTSSPSDESGEDVARSLVTAERAVDDLEGRLANAWTLLHYYGALPILATIIILLLFIEPGGFLSYGDTLLVSVTVVAWLLIPLLHPAIERLRYLRD